MYTQYSCTINTITNANCYCSAAANTNTATHIYYTILTAIFQLNLG